MFRFDGPALSVVRRTTRDVTVGDTVIAAGENVYCMLSAANRDPARHSDPDRFDVERADVRHLGLGYGLHFCLGAALSRLEAEVVVGGLLGLGNLSLDRVRLGGAAPRYFPNLAIRGLESLPIRFG
jgi:pimeloyl-[acyl-carrier protein] synthase